MNKTIIFGLPRIGLSIVLGIEVYSIFALYTIGYQLAPFLVGFTLCIGYICTAIFSFFFGWISDIKYTRWGRRKPYLFIFSPILCTSFIFLMMPSLVITDLNNQALLFFWLLFWEIIFRISYSAMTPYQAWLAEQFEVKDRPKVSQIQSVFNLLATLILWIFNFLVLTQVFEQLETEPNFIPIDYSIPVFIFALITIIVVYIVVFFMPTEPHYKINSNMLSILKTSLKNRNFMIISFVLGFSSIAWSMLIPQVLPFIEVVLNFSQLENLINLIIIFACIIIFLEIWRRLIAKVGKKKSLIYVFVLTIAFLPFTLLILIPMNSYFIISVILMSAIGAGLAGYFLIPAVVYADIAQDDQKITGELKAGTYTGFPLIILNLFQAIGVLFLGFINELPIINVGSSTYSIGLILWGPICALILLVSLIFIIKFIKIDYDWEQQKVMMK